MSLTKIVKYLAPVLMATSVNCSSSTPAPEVKEHNPQYQENLQREKEEVKKNTEMVLRLAYKIHRENNCVVLYDQKKIVCSDYFEIGAFAFTRMIIAYNEKKEGEMVELHYHRTDRENFGDEANLSNILLSRTSTLSKTSTLSLDKIKYTSVVDVKEEEDILLYTKMERILQDSRTNSSRSVVYCFDSTNEEFEATSSNDKTETFECDPEKTKTSPKPHEHTAEEKDKL